MTKKIALLFCILVFGAFLRLYKLNSNPPSLYWDEASLGYNAYAVATTGHDEHGEFFPLARFIAFGDYKPPGYIYVTAFFIKMFGLSEFVIRFPSALAGISMIFLTFILVRKLTNNEAAGLIASFLLAISPWGIQLSRAAFEAHLAACFNLIAIIAFLYTDKKNWLLPFSMIFFVFSFYTFNANRILAPLFIGLLSALYARQLFSHKKWIVISVLIGGIMLMPSIAYLQSRESRLRFTEVSIFTSLDVVKKANERIARNNNTLWAKIIHNRRIYFFKEFLIHYFDNFKGEFLFVSGDGNPRLSTQDIGEMYLFEAPFLIVGLGYFLLKRNKNGALILCWLLLAPIPAATARETPHMLRIASVVPMFQVITAMGIYVVWQWVRAKHQIIKYSFSVVFISIVLGSFMYYQHNYWVHYPVTWAGEWQYGYKQMVKEVKRLERQYDKILITDYKGRPYIYFLLYGQTNPLDYVKIRRAERDWYGLWNVYGYGKYEFAQYVPKNGERILKVAQPGTYGTSSKKIEDITDPSGNVVFEIGEL